MPLELRYISFDRREVLDAVSVTPVRQFADLGSRQIVDYVTRMVDGKRALFVHLAGADQGTTTERPITKETLAAALVLYCRTHRVPLPKKWEKSIEIEQDRVVMRVGRRGAEPAEMKANGHINVENTAAATVNDIAAA